MITTATGIDKTVIKGFKLNYMDKEKLLNHAYKNVILQTSEYGIIVSTSEKEEERISYLKITDGHLFKYLMLGVKQNRGVLNPYYHLEITISELTDNNLIPLNTTEYINMLNRIKDYLLDIYGLDIDFSNAYYDLIELNKTAVMDKPFKEYDYLLNLMGKLVPKRYKDRVYHTDELNILKQVEFYNGSMKGKIYDKTRQLLERFKIVLDKNYMRIEYTLNGSKKIETALGERTINKITDEAIKNFLNEQIERDLIEPLEKHIIEGSKKLITIATALRKKNRNNWVSSLIDKSLNANLLYTSPAGELKVPLLVDTLQIKEAIKKVSGSNAYRNIKTAEKNYNSFSNSGFNIDNFKEIKNKFLLH